jgi:hypothetical protein
VIVTVLICIAVALFCFFNGMVLAGILSLAGILPGAGMVALVITSILLALSDHFIAAAFPLIVIVYNIWMVLVLKRER